MNAAETTSTERARRALRKALPSTVYKCGARTLDAVSILRVLRRDEALRVIRGRLPARADMVTVHPRNLQHPFVFRSGTSDVDEVIYTIGRESYGQYFPDGDIRVILDVGANIGDTAAWYLSRFPKSRVYSIEPDTGNCALCRRNCAPYGARAVLLKGALWWKEEALWLTTACQPDGHQVSANRTELPVPAFTVPGLMRLWDIQTVDIFRCDIEGAEAEIFSKGSLEWLRQVRCVVIETHSPGCLAAVSKPLQEFGFGIRSYRNLQYFLR
jgi:FkbM family methyltransferase